jgi:pimeloyl-ACP methyl ester carboxylesterase
MVSVTTIFVPGNADHSKLVSYATAEDADNINCAPSYNFRKGNNNTDSTASDVMMIELFLLKGWIVSAPDYEGPIAAYAAGKLMGHNILDGLRATINHLDLKKPCVTMWGYSGGAISTGWAAALAPSYAKDLHIVGVATGGTPASLVTSIYNLDTYQDALYGGLVFVSTLLSSTFIISDVLPPHTGSIWRCS